MPTFFYSIYIPELLFSSLREPNSHSDRKYNKKPQPNEMAICIPQELLLEILVRLPVKSLLRFRSVSKSWNTLISSSNFITCHINHNKAYNGEALVRFYYEDTREDKYALYSDNNSNFLDKIMEIEFPNIHIYEFFYIIGCVDGLVCLMDSYQRTNTVLLWNPMIRKYLTLPKPNYELTGQELMKTALGFGFDTLSHDYKYVRIYNKDGKSIVEIFKLRTGCWIIADMTSSLASVRPEAATYLDGVLHWMAYGHLITAFDLGTETFTGIMLPEELQCSDIGAWDDIFIAVWCGLLSIVARESEGSVCLWVMKEYGVQESWVKQFIIRGSFRGLAGVRRNGELILYDHNRYVIGYDPETRHTKNDIFQLEGPLICMQMVSYVESLVLLKEGEDVPAMVAVETEDKQD